MLKIVQKCTAEVVGICTSRDIDLMKIRTSNLKSSQSLKNAGFFNFFPGCSIDAALSALKITNTHAITADFSGTPSYLATSPVAQLKDLMCWTAYLLEYIMLFTLTKLFFRNYF